MIKLICASIILSTLNFFLVRGTTLSSDRGPSAGTEAVRNLLNPEARVLSPEEEARPVGAGRGESDIGLRRSNPVKPVSHLHSCRCSSGSNDMTYVT